MRYALALLAVLGAGVRWGHAADDKLKAPLSGLGGLNKPVGRLPARPMSPHAPVDPEGKDVNLKVSFKVKDGILEGAGNFTVRSGSQANYVAGGEDPYEIDNGKGTGVEFKKRAVIVNVLPVALPEGKGVDVQCQFELSGALAPVGSLKERPVETFQYQTEFTAELGKGIVLVDEPGRRIEMTVEAAVP